MTWSPADLPDLSGHTSVVTGPTVGGLGFHTALELARHGSRVVLAGRTPEKLDDAARAIRAEAPDASTVPLVLDLADLSSVRAAAAEAAGLGPVDLLVNNAGIMAVPHRRTADGIESQLATNHLGPFLLTGLLLDQLAASGDGRVVTLSSQMHRVARSAPLEDPRTGRPRGRWHTYARTKLANLLFTLELDRRLRRRGLPVRALAAHPGFAGTHLVVNGQLSAPQGRLGALVDRAVKVVAQPAEAGAWPTLMAATDDLPGGTYVGPGGPGEGSGPPQVVGTSRHARDEIAQGRLWELSEQVVGLAWP